MPWVIERNDDAGGVFFSIGDRSTHPTHGWSGVENATQFGRKKDCSDFAGVFLRGEMASGDINFREIE